MTVSSELDARFRTTAAAEGLLDVAYDLVDSPIGPLLVASTPRGLCRISFDPEPEREAERLARDFGLRVLRAPRAVDEPRRELTDYFEGRRTSFDLAVDLAPLGPFHRVVGSTGSLVGYGGGLHRKAALLRLEGALLG